MLGSVEKGTVAAGSCVVDASGSNYGRSAGTVARGYLRSIGVGTTRDCSVIVWVWYVWAGTTRHACTGCWVRISAARQTLPEALDVSSSTDLNLSLLYQCCVCLASVSCYAADPSVPLATEIGLLSAVKNLLVTTVATVEFRIRVDDPAPPEPEGASGTIRSRLLSGAGFPWELVGEVTAFTVLSVSCRFRFRRDQQSSLP